MARKETVTVQDILNTAFEMTREEGFQNVTARRLAARMGCSTQPIFRVYKGMPELGRALYEKATAFYEDYYAGYLKMQPYPFVDLGMAYIQFSRKERNLFYLIFLSEERKGKSLYDLLNGSHSAVSKEISKAKMAGCQNPQELFMKMWIFIQGVASMVITGDYDLSEAETLTLLQDTYRAVAGK